MNKLLRNFLSNALGLVEIALVVRVVLRVLSANPAAGIVAFVYYWTDFLLQPVQYIFPNIPIIGNSVLDLVAIAAMIFYAAAYFVLDKAVMLLLLSE